MVKKSASMMSLLSKDLLREQRSLSSQRSVTLFLRSLLGLFNPFSNCKKLYSIRTVAVRLERRIGKREVLIGRRDSHHTYFTFVQVFCGLCENIKKNYSS